MIVQIFMIFMNQEASWSSFDDSIGWELPEKFSFSLTPWKYLFICLFFSYYFSYLFVLHQFRMKWYLSNLNPSEFADQVVFLLDYVIITPSLRHNDVMFYTFEFRKLLFNLSKYFSELHWIASRTSKIDEVESFCFFWFMTGCIIYRHSNHQWTYVRIFCETPDLNARMSSSDVR